jgi:hypothetical protein
MVADLAIVDLDRKISRAMTRAKGVKLSAADLDLLTSIGLLERLAGAKAAALMETARCRASREGSTSAGRSGSISPGAPAGSRSRHSSTSTGMTPAVDDSAARARAREMFG